MSQAQGPLLAWSAAYLGVEKMPEPLSREGVVAGLGQGLPRGPSTRAQEHSLVKAFVLDLPHSGGWAPMVPCMSVYVCVCVHTLYVFAGHGSLCQSEMLPVLGWRWGGGHEWEDSVPCRREMACPWGPWPLRPPASSLRESPARGKGQGLSREVASVGIHGPRGPWRGDLKAGW